MLKDAKVVTLINELLATSDHQAQCDSKQPSKSAIL